MNLNEEWVLNIKNKGVDFVYFVDISTFSTADINEYTCAILFGKGLSKKYIKALRAGENPKPHEVHTIEHKMERLAVKFAEQLEKQGYKSTSKVKFGRLSHKTVALRAGLGFIGKNNLLVNKHYGCALMFGKVLTTAPFVTINKTPKNPQCGDCSICVDICPTKSLLGKIWDVKTTRDEIMVRKLCAVCAKCMIWCPYTDAYVK